MVKRAMNFLDTNETLRAFVWALLMCGIPLLIFIAANSEWVPVWLSVPLFLAWFVFMYLMSSRYDRVERIDG